MGINVGHRGEGAIRRDSHVYGLVPTGILGSTSVLVDVSMTETSSELMLAT